MNRRIAMLGASMAAALLVSGALAAESLKSGPQVGDQLSPFEPKNITGSAAGKKRCLV